MPGPIPEGVETHNQLTAYQGSGTSNMYIKFGTQKGPVTLGGKNVDAKLKQTDRLLSYADRISRDVNPAADQTMFSAGQIDMNWIYVEIMRTSTMPFIQNSLFQGKNIDTITVYRTAVIGGKLVIIETIAYSTNIIVRVESKEHVFEGKKMDTLGIWFRATKMQDTIISYDQAGKKLGQVVSLLDVSKGTLGAKAK